VPLALDQRSIGLWIASSLNTWKPFALTVLAQGGSRVAIDFDAAMRAAALAFGRLPQARGDG